MKKIIIAILLVCMMTALCACGEKTITAEIDASDIIVKGFEDSGLELGKYLDGFNLNITGIGKKSDYVWTADIEKNSEAVNALNDAVSEAIYDMKGISGTWETDVDIFPALKKAIDSAAGYEVGTSLSFLHISARVVFAEEGIYAVFFNNEDLQENAKELTASCSEALSKQIGKFIPDEDTWWNSILSAITNTTVDNVVKTRVDAAVCDMIDLIHNGVAGTYEVVDSTIYFNGDTAGCTFEKTEDTIKIISGDPGGLIGLAVAADKVLIKQK